ncbi:MAG: peptide deformylase [Bdellovibrio sp.]|nr:MAG: peptide deformylase [Bdellovibrio sp.]
MAILEVLKFPDSRLRRKCQEVEQVTPELKKLAEDMLETMYHYKGIGLAAAQVNQLVRLFVADVRPKNPETGEYDLEAMTELERQAPMPLVIFNPVITHREGKVTYDEGCLSVPSYFETVERSQKIIVEGLDLNGQPMKLETDGLLAICIQHEIDHLDGKLFIDRLSPIKSNRIKAKIKKFGYPQEEKEGQPI